MSTTQLPDGSRQDTATAAGLSEQRFSPSFENGPSLGLLDSEPELKPELGASARTPADRARAIAVPSDEAWCAPGVHRA